MTHIFFLFQIHIVCFSSKEIKPLDTALATVKGGKNGAVEQPRRFVVYEVQTSELVHVRDN